MSHIPSNVEGFSAVPPNVSETSPLYSPPLIIVSMMYGWTLYLYVLVMLSFERLIWKERIFRYILDAGVL